MPRGPELSRQTVVSIEGYLPSESRVYGIQPGIPTAFAASSASSAIDTESIQKLGNNYAESYRKLLVFSPCLGLSIKSIINANAILSCCTPGIISKVVLGS